MITARCSDFLIHETLDRIAPVYDTDPGSVVTVINHSFQAEDLLAGNKGIRPPFLDLVMAEEEGIDRLAAKCILGDVGRNALSAERLEKLDWDRMKMVMKQVHDVELCAVLCSPGTYMKKLWGLVPPDVHVGITQEIHYDVLVAVPSPEFLGFLTKVVNLKRRPRAAGFLRHGRTSWFKTSSLEPRVASCDPSSFMAMLEVMT